LVNYGGVKTSLLIKIVGGVIALGVFGFLFKTSLDDARTTAYTMERQHLRGWTLVLDPSPKPNDPVVSLRPMSELPGGMFRQVFARAMESLNTPVAPAIPVILRDEFDRVLADTLTPDSALAAARSAGLESAPITPRCLVYRRVSEPGGTRQVYFVSFDAPAISQFRHQIGLDPAALSPILFIAGAGTDFNAWLPQRVNPASDCLAPIEIVDS